MKGKLVALMVVVIAGKSLRAQNSANVITYINTYKDLAISEMQRSGIPASIILSQGIHETDAGTSDLVKNSNNHFGIKCKDTWTGAVVYHDDDSRQECFRSYNAPGDSYRDHSDFLRNSPRYAFLFRLDPDDYEGWAYGLRKAGYATNIRYSQILIKLIRDYNLQQYTLIASGKLKPAEEPLQPALVPGSEPGTGAADRQVAIAGILPPPQYPEEEFTINNTRVIFAKEGTSLLSVAGQHELSLARLLEFNDLKEEDVLVESQLLFLQRKRRIGATAFHIVRQGENLYGICQSEGIRYQDLQEMNQLKPGARPAAGEKIYLQSTAPARPVLTDAAPRSITHIVQLKETIYSISKKYGVEADQLRQWNNLASTDLRIGQELVIYRN